MISFAEQPGGKPKPTKRPRPKAGETPALPGKVDSANHFEVVGTPTGVAIKKAPLNHEVIEKDRAVNLAAWLVAMSGASGDDFVRMLTEIAKK